MSHDDEGTDSRRPDGGVFDLDEVLSALTARERRFALYSLRQEEIMSTEELANATLALEQNVPETQLTPEEVAVQERRLVHVHLPHLQSLTFVEYDSMSKTVRFRNPPRKLVTLLDTCAELESRQIT